MIRQSPVLSKSLTTIRADDFAMSTESIPENLPTTLTVTSLPPQTSLTLPGACRRWRLQFAHAFWRQRWSLIFILVGGAILVALAIFLPALRFSTSGMDSAPPTVSEWLSRLQNVVGFLTLVVAVVVWLGELREDWEEALPKRMSVFFFLDRSKDGCTRDEPEHPVIVARNVWLAGEGDLRQWAMQVAAQAVTAYVKVDHPAQLRLDFGPDLFSSPKCILADSRGKPHQHYTIRFNLTHLPAPLERVWRESPVPLCLYQNLAATPAELRLVKVDEVVAVLSCEPDWPDAVETTQ